MSLSQSCLSPIDTREPAYPLRERLVHAAAVRGLTKLSERYVSPAGSRWTSYDCSSTSLTRLVHAPRTWGAPTRAIARRAVQLSLCRRRDRQGLSSMKRLRGCRERYAPTPEPADREATAPAMPSGAFAALRRCRGRSTCELGREQVVDPHDVMRAGEVLKCRPGPSIASARLSLSVPRETHIKRCPKRHRGLRRIIGTDMPAPLWIETLGCSVRRSATTAQKRVCARPGQATVQPQLIGTEHLLLGSSGSEWVAARVLDRARRAPEGPQAVSSSSAAATHDITQRITLSSTKKVIELG